MYDEFTQLTCSLSDTKWFGWWYRSSQSISLLQIHSELNLIDVHPLLPGQFSFFKSTDSKSIIFLKWQRHTVFQLPVNSQAWLCLINQRYMQIIVSHNYNTVRVAMCIISLWYFMFVNRIEYIDETQIKCIAYMYMYVVITHLNIISFYFRFRYGSGVLKLCCQFFICCDI